MKRLLVVTTVAALTVVQSAYASNPQEMLAQSNSNYFKAQGQAGITVTSAFDGQDDGLYPDQHARLIEMNHRYFQDSVSNAPYHAPNAVVIRDNRANSGGATDKCLQQNSAICK